MTDLSGPNGRSIPMPDGAGTGRAPRRAGSSTAPEPSGEGRGALNLELNVARERARRVASGLLEIVARLLTGGPRGW